MIFHVQWWSMINHDPWSMRIHDQWWSMTNDMRAYSKMFGHVCRHIISFRLLWFIHMLGGSAQKSRMQSFVFRFMLAPCRHEPSTVDLVPILTWGTCTLRRRLPMYICLAPRSTCVGHAQQCGLNSHGCHVMKPMLFSMCS